MFKATLCAIAVTLFFLSHSGETAFIENTIKKFTVKEGEPLELKCDVKRSEFDNPDLQNTWHRDDALPLPNGALVYYGETLKFPSITRDHFGVYACSVDGGGFSNQKWEPMVEVQFKPEVTRAYRLKDSDTNNEIVFACEARSYPSPQVTWLKNGKEAGFPVNTYQFSDTRTYSILRVQKTTENLKTSFSCQFKNSIGVAEKTVDNSADKLPMILNNTMNFFSAEKGQKIELECNADGSPNPRITWHKKNGGNLPTGDFIYDGNVLKFDSISHEDAGDYICTADNGLGSSQRTYNLEVKFAPITTTQKLEVTDTQIRYGCYQKANPSSNILLTLLKNGQSFNAGYVSKFDYNATDSYVIYSLPKTEDNLKATFSCYSNEDFYSQIVGQRYDRR